MEEAAEAAGNSRGRKRIVGYGSREPERVKERTQLALEDISRTHAEKKAAKELAIKS